MRTKQVIVTEYCESWAKAFLAIKEHLLRAVPKEFDIEHVGSTSVKGLSAKPIIDIDIVYDDQKDKYKLIDYLSTLGYVHEGTLGIEHRDAFKYDNLPYMKHHLYIVKRDSKAYKDHMYLKKFLSTHEVEKRQYSELKMYLANKYPNDIDSYYQEKSPLIEEILKKATRYIMEK